MSDPQFLGHVLGYLKSVEATQPHRMEAAKMAEKRVTAQEKAMAPEVRPDAVSGVNKTAIPTGGPLGALYQQIPNHPGITASPREQEAFAARHVPQLTPELAQRVAAMKAYSDEQKRERAAEQVSRPQAPASNQLQLQGAPQGPGSPVGVLYGDRQR
jgi:hypothetical protein